MLIYHKNANFIFIRQITRLVIPLNNSLEHDFQAFFTDIFTKELLEQLMDFFPISKSGISYWESIKKLQDLFLKLVENVNSYPFLSEVFVQYSEEQSTTTGSSVTFGRLSKEQFYSYLRERSFHEDEHLGRYILSWLLLSLYSITDQYVNQLAIDMGRSFTPRQRRLPLKEKMAHLLKTLDIWDEFKAEKTYYFPEIETTFTTLLEKRHKVAHQDLTPEWIKELFNRTFKQTVAKQMTIQKNVLELLGVDDEYSDFEETAQFIATIQIITSIFLLYVGYFDQLIEKETRESEKMAILEEMTRKELLNLIQKEKAAIEEWDNVDQVELWLDVKDKIHELCDRIEKSLYEPSIEIPESNDVLRWILDQIDPFTLREHAKQSGIRVERKDGVLTIHRSDPTIK